MLEVGRLILRLPTAYAARAPSIARLVGEALGQLDPGTLSGQTSSQIASLTLPPVSAPPGVGDVEIAQTVAAAIMGGIRSEE